MASRGEQAITPSAPPRLVPDIPIHGKRALDASRACSRSGWQTDRARLPAEWGAGLNTKAGEAGRDRPLDHKPSHYRRRSMLSDAGGGIGRSCSRHQRTSSCFASSSGETGRACARAGASRSTPEAELATTCLRFRCIPWLPPCASPCDSFAATRLPRLRHQSPCERCISMPVPSTSARLRPPARVPSPDSSGGGFCPVSAATRPLVSPIPDEGFDQQEHQDTELGRSIVIVKRHLHRAADRALDAGGYVVPDGGPDDIPKTPGQAMSTLPLNLALDRGRAPFQRHDEEVWVTVDLDGLWGMAKPLFPELWNLPLQRNARISYGHQSNLGNAESLAPVERGQQLRLDDAPQAPRKALFVRLTHIGSIDRSITPGPIAPRAQSTG